MPSWTCLPDAGQIGREEAFPAQQFINGSVGRLRLQIDLEFLPGVQESTHLLRDFTGTSDGVVWVTSLVPSATAPVRRNGSGRPTRTQKRRAVHAFSIRVTVILNTCGLGRTRLA